MYPTYFCLLISQVEVPGHEGKAGMACVKISQNIPPDKMHHILCGLAIHVCNQLPAYARPLFLRTLHSSMDMTSTFKPIKANLQKEGFNPSSTFDPIYFLKFDRSSKPEYKALTPLIFEQIVLKQFHL